MIAMSYGFSISAIEIHHYITLLALRCLSKETKIFKRVYCRRVHFSMYCLVMAELSRLNFNKSTPQ